MQLTLWPLLTCALCVCPPSGHNLRCNLTQEKKYRVSEALQACQALPNETITLLWQCPHYTCFFFSFVIAHPNRMWTDQDFPKKTWSISRKYTTCVTALEVLALFCWVQGHCIEHSRNTLSPMENRLRAILTCCPPTNKHWISRQHWLLSNNKSSSVALNKWKLYPNT